MSISFVGTLITILIYDRIIVPIMRKIIDNERGINITGININMKIILIFILMVVATLVEAKRLRMATHDALTVWEIDHNYMIVVFHNPIFNSGRWRFIFYSWFARVLL